MEEKNFESIIKRGQLFLEEGKWFEAQEYFNKALDSDPENPELYVGLLMTSLHISREDKLINAAEMFNHDKNYLYALRFADEKRKGELEYYSNKNIYNHADKILNESDIEQSDKLKLAENLFDMLEDFEDSEEKVKACKIKIQKGEEAVQKRKRIAKENRIKEEEKRDMRTNKALKIIVLLLTVVVAALIIVCILR